MTRPHSSLVSASASPLGARSSWLVASVALAAALGCAAGGGQGESTVTAGAQPSTGGPASSPGATVAPGVSTEPGQLFNPAELEPTDECDSELPVVYRDFSQAHPDFEMAFSGDGVRHKLIEPTLGADGKPVFLNNIGCPANNGTPGSCNGTRDKPVLSTAEAFGQWYRDTPGVNIAFERTMVLTESTTKPGTYEFSSNDFFPIGKDEGFKNTPTNQDKNFLFTTELHVTFEYFARQTFTFRGDDDMWIFINGKLAMDLGGMHGSENGTIDFDAQAADLGIAVGRAYPMDIFHAERHTSASNFGVETNIACFTPSIPR